MAATQLARVEPAAMRRFDSLDPLTVADMLARSGYFGDVKEAGQALAKILAGQELGIGPIAALMGVYFAQGKVTYSANIMASAIKKHPAHNYRIRRHDDAACEIEFFEGGESLGLSTFTIEDAKRGGLLDGPNKHNWSKWPRNMLFARAMSNGAKWHCPGVFGGVTPYTPDELGAAVTVTDDGEMVVQEETRPSLQVVEPTPQEQAHAEAAVATAMDPDERAALLEMWPDTVKRAAEHKVKDHEKFGRQDPAQLSDDALRSALNLMVRRITAAEQEAPAF
jgi:hypothetical protein